MTNFIELPEYWEKPVNPTLAFELWVELGSTNKAAAEMNRRGIKNHKGNDINPISVSYAAWTWVFDHPFEAKPYFDVGLFEPRTDDEWYRFLVRKASKHFLRSRGKNIFRRWIEACGFEEYCELYKAEHPRAYKAHKDTIST